MDTDALNRLAARRRSRLDLATCANIPHTLRDALMQSCAAVAEACERVIDEMLDASHVH